MKTYEKLLKMFSAIPAEVWDDAYRKAEESTKKMNEEIAEMGFDAWNAKEDARMEAIHPNPFRKR